MEDDSIAFETTLGKSEDPNSIKLDYKLTMDDVDYLRPSLDLKDFMLYAIVTIVASFIFGYLILIW